MRIGNRTFSSVADFIFGSAYADEAPNGPFFEFDGLIITPEDLVFSGEDAKALFVFNYGPQAERLDPNTFGFEQRAFAQALFIRQVQAAKASSVLSSLFRLKPPSPVAIIKALGKSSVKAQLAEGKLNRASIAIANKHRGQFGELVLQAQ